MARPSTTHAHINRIATAVPPFEVHERFQDFVRLQVAQNPRSGPLFQRMVEVSGIERRYSCLAPERTFYRWEKFPDTSARMREFEKHAPELAAAAIERLKLGHDRERISHLIVTCCTGFSAPGLDLEIIERCGLRSSVERTIIGFMGCYAAINALKLARHIVRSEPDAQVLVVNLELNSLHLQDTVDLEKLLSFLLFADGCAASLVTAEPQGLAMDSFHAVLVPDTREMIQWLIRDSGFELVLSGRVPGSIRRGLKSSAGDILRGGSPHDIDLWGVHPGGRTVLDAVESAFGLPAHKLAPAREVLRRYGNMSSATVMFVLEALMRQARPGDSGCAMSFGPGMVAETMLFHAAEIGVTVADAHAEREPAEIV